jgi:hypothetical protein
VTRIPELEQELVAAAARLQTPQRVVRPAVRAALAAGALAVAVALIAVIAADDHGDRGAHRVGPSGSRLIVKLADDREAGVRFRLEGRVLTVSLLASAPDRTRQRVDGKRLRATCAEAFAQGPGPGPGPDPLQTRTRIWPAGRTQVRFHFLGDITRIATWCRLEDPVAGHVAFVRFRGSTRSQAQKIEQTGNRWARLFSASGRGGCKYMTQPACERVACEKISGPIDNCKALSSQFVRSFRGAKVQEIAIKGRRAAARYSNGETIELIHINGYAVGGVWWIDELGGNAGRGFFK